MSADPKFRQDINYIFFLLLVKESIQLQRCVSTYLRQARRLPQLTKQTLNNLNNADLVRYNRGFNVFKNVRGTAPYYEEAKKNLNAILRQRGCPTIFLTLSSAEFDWPELLKEVAETVYRKKFTSDEIKQMPDKVRNKLISENVVITTLHFQKRIEKLFSIMGYQFFHVGDILYHASSYFFRIEFQQRGSPHLHSLLWLKDDENLDAPSFWNHSESNKSNDESSKIRKKQIEEFADSLLLTSFEKMSCANHEVSQSDCFECMDLQEKVQKYQCHKHTTTCAKKKKCITIKEIEGHGRFDGFNIGPKLSNIFVCRFHFPKFL